MSSTAKGSVTVFLGALLWGMVSLFVTPLSEGGLDSMQIALIRVFMAAVVLAIATLITDRSLFRFELKNLGLLMLNGLICGAVFNIFYFQTIIHSEASVAAMLLYTSPIFVMVLARIIFKEPITGRKILMMAMTVVGCVFVAGFIGHGTHIPLTALFTGVATGATYGVYTVLTRFNARRIHPLTVTLYIFIFGTLFMLPLGKPVETVRMLASDHSLIPYALLFGPICSSLANWLFTWGIAQIEANRAAILAASEPLGACLVGMFIFHDSHEPLKLLGIALVLAAIILQGIEPRSADSRI